jgi:hypothetical protein
MKIEIAKGKDISLDFYKNDINEYEYNNVLVIYNNDIIISHSIVIGKELFNLVVLSNVEEVLNLLISNNYKNISFDFNHIDKKLLENMLLLSFNNPYIIIDSKIKVEVINLLYKPKQPQINIKFITYLLNEFGKGLTTPCKATGVFNKNLLNTVYKSINDKDSGEISGKLKITKTVDQRKDIVFEVALDNFKKGDKVEADVVESRYNFHTHPVSAYLQYNCDLGWPSKDDYVIFITSSLDNKKPTIFHMIFTKEGVYVLSIPKESIDSLQKIKNKGNLEDIFEKYIQENLEIDKLNFKMEMGVDVDNFGKINSVKSYLKFIHSAKPFEIVHENETLSFRIVNIQYFDWKGHLGLLESELNRIDFTYYYPKINGNCIMDEEHVRETENKPRQRTRRRKPGL